MTELCGYVHFCIGLLLIECKKNKGKGHHRTEHEVPEGEYRYSCTLFLTSVQDRVSGQCHAMAALTPGNEPRTHCVGGWVGWMPGLDSCGKCYPHQDFLDHPALSE